MSAIPPSLLQTMQRISERLQAGQFRVAHDELATVVAANPDFAEGLRLFAGTKQALGDPVAAEELLRRALALAPDWTPTSGTLGELLLISGRAAEAEPLLQRALAGTPAFPRAALLLARHYNDCGRPGDALGVAAPVCLSGRADAELFAQHVAALVALGRHEEAVAGYRAIVGASPNNLAASHALALALNAAGQYEEAERVAQRTLASGYRTAALYHAHARSLTARGSLDSAELALRECLQRDPRLAEAHNNLAQLVWMRTGDVAQTTEMLDRALQTFANDDALWATKAAILQGAGDARAAYACLSQRASRPGASPMLSVRAGLAALEFDPPTALDLAQKALRVVPANTVAQTLVAAAQLGVGDARGALDHIESLLTQAPDDQYLIALQTTAWRLLGDARYADLCDYEKLVVPLQLEAPAPWPDMASFLVDLRASLNRLHDPDGHALLFQSLRQGTETTQDLSRSDDPAIRGLFTAFAQPIHEYLERVGRGTDPLRRRNQGRWRFNGSWSVRLRSSGFHTSHVHPRGWISSACYIELPDSMHDPGSDQGILTFGQPGIATTPALASEYSVRPCVGLLVLFPSYFWHGTVPFASAQGRLTVAFDAVPAV